MYKYSLLVFLCLSLSACSVYKTSTSDIRFNGTKFHEEPVIPVDIKGVDNEQMRFLGWVEAFVINPAFFRPAPTQQQANYVLAHEAKKQGADALMHISYKESVTTLGQKRITARGQAIELRKDDVKLSVPQEEGVINDEMDQIELIEPSLVNSNAKTELESPPNISPIAEEPDMGEAELDIVNSQLLITRSAEQAVSEQQAVSSLVLKPEAKEKENTSGMQLMRHLNQFYDDEANRIQLMLNNASFIYQRAKADNDKQTMLAAERLMEQLQAQQLTFKAFSP